MVAWFFGATRLAQPVLVRSQGRRMFGWCGHLGSGVMVDPANLVVMDLEAQAGHRRRFLIPYGRWRHHLPWQMALGGESSLHRPGFERSNG